MITYSSRGGNQSRWFRNRLRNQTEFHGFTVRIHVLRHSIFYVYNIVIPLLVVIMIALACTHFPSESEEKPNLLMSVILAYVFFMVYCTVLYCCTLTFFYKYSYRKSASASFVEVELTIEETTMS